VVLVLGSLVVAFVTGIGWVLLGGEPLDALQVGAAALVGCFGICMSAAAFIHRQDG
jgi:drug/metabolite transporter (DMT)-like permease